MKTIATERLILRAEPKKSDQKQLRAGCRLVRVDVVSYAPTHEPACDYVWLEMASYFGSRLIFFRERPFVPYLWRKSGVDLIPKGCAVEMYNGGEVSLWNNNRDSHIAEVELALTWEYEQ